MDHRVQIQGNEKDIVIPFHYLDDMWHNKALLLDFTYRFDDLLDADMLKSSLERLMEMDGWRKLGGRVRINVGLPRQRLQNKVTNVFRT